MLKDKIIHLKLWWTAQRVFYGLKLAGLTVRWKGGQE